MLASLRQVELGLYESLVSQELESGLAALIDLDVVTRGIDDVDQPLVLSRYVQSLVETALNAARDPHQRLLVVNSLIANLANADARVSGPTRQLLSVTGRPRQGVQRRVPNGQALPSRTAFV